MANKEEGQLDFEALDTIEIPEETTTVLVDKDDPQEQEPQEQQDQKDEQETKEQRRERKRSDYQKRIGELVRRAHEAEERAAAAEAKVELVEQNRANFEKTAVESTASLLKQREQELIERRRIAEDTGDLANYSKASDELFEVRGKMRNQPAETLEKKPAPTRQDDPGIVPEAAEWVERNPWFNDEKNGHLADEVVRLQNKLIRDRKYNLNNPVQAKKLYEELDAKLREQPEFDVVVGVTDEEEEQEEPGKKVEKQAPRSHIAPPSRGGEAPPRQKAGELSNHDIAAIKRAGLDPNNPKVRATYIKYNRKQA